jgi:hypothetical protein
MNPRLIGVAVLLGGSLCGRKPGAAGGSMPRQLARQLWSYLKISERRLWKQGGRRQTNRRNTSANAFSLERLQVSAQRGLPPLTKPSRRRRFRPIPRTIGQTRLRPGDVVW